MPSRPALAAERVANAIAVTAGPAAVALLTCWAIRWPAPLMDRPILSAMVFVILCSATTGALVASALARCHLSTAASFAAGVRVGAEVKAPQRAGKPGLRVVE